MVALSPPTISKLLNICDAGNHGSSKTLLPEEIGLEHRLDAITRHSFG